MPSILEDKKIVGVACIRVLNLVISGMPSILIVLISFQGIYHCFKPCYKWNAFNTYLHLSEKLWKESSFKPCYKWNAFNTYEWVSYKTNPFSF